MKSLTFVDGSGVHQLFPSFFRDQKETLNTVLTHIYLGIIMRRDVHVGLISIIFVMLFIAACFAGCTSLAPTTNPATAPTAAAKVLNQQGVAVIVAVTTAAPVANVTAAAPAANITAAAPAANVTAAK